MNIQLKPTSSLVLKMQGRYSLPIMRVLVLGFVVAGGSVLPVMAASVDQPEGQKFAEQKSGSKKNTSSEHAYRHVEERIATLHEKLAITEVQEEKWAVVAQTMRDNETSMHGLIKERHNQTEQVSAIDDLQSYLTIAQAHVDGLKKLIPAFQALYSDMSDAQKKKADASFSHFEGWQHKHEQEKHK